MTSQELKAFCDIVNACNIMQDIAQMDSCTGNNQQEDHRIIAANHLSRFIEHGCYRLQISVISCYNAANALREHGITRVKPTQVYPYFKRG